MYKSVIEFKKETPLSKVTELTKIADRAFNNRGGVIINSSEKTHNLIYAADKQLFGCLHLGILNLDDERGFKEHVKTWQYIDEENPNENCDVLRELALPIY